MTKRFRLIAGPNGSGKSTLKRRLERDYAVNFYDFLNADDIYAEVKATGAYAPQMAVDGEALRAYAEASSYSDDVKGFFRDGTISSSTDCITFADPSAVNSYTVALLTNFLQAEHIRQGMSFSQETVFSHPSKVAALAAARAAGFRTYLYFVATEDPVVNVLRVSNRATQGGHSVPEEKILSRYARSLDQVAAALPHLDRAYFFDNSGETMRFLAEWSADGGFAPAKDDRSLPQWFCKLISAMEEKK